MKMKKLVGIVILLAGVAMLIVGLTLTVPGTYLTSYTELEGVEIDGDTASTIREYVGGDAYNYIIGASLVGAKISGVMIAKAVYTAIGTLIICFGLACLFCGRKETKELCKKGKESKKTSSAFEKATEAEEEAKDVPQKTENLAQLSEKEKTMVENTEEKTENNMDEELVK